MNPIINLYCKTIIYTIEERKKSVMQQIIENPSFESEGYFYLEHYDQLLLDKYIELEKLLAEFYPIFSEKE